MNQYSIDVIQLYSMLFVEFRVYWDLQGLEMFLVVVCKFIIFFI